MSEKRENPFGKGQAVALPPIIGWAPGMRVGGKYLGIEPARKANYSPLVRINVEVMVDPPTPKQEDVVLPTSGEMAFAGPAGLVNRLDRVPVGSWVGIVCHGKTIETDSGTAWEFDVYTQ